MEKVKNKLHFAGSFHVDETNNGGGILEKCEYGLVAWILK